MRRHFEGTVSFLADINDVGGGENCLVTSSTQWQTEGRSGGILVNVGERLESFKCLPGVYLKVEYDLFPLYWSWDHFSVEKA